MLRIPRNFFTPIGRQTTHLARIGAAICSLLLTGSAKAAYAQRSAATSARPGTSPAALAFTGVTVIDVTDGRRLDDQTVLIVRNRIRAVGSGQSVRIPKWARIIDARGKYVIPGLWDMHVHTGSIFGAHPDIFGFNPKAFDGRSLIPDPGAPDIMYPSFIATGVTGVREVGTSTPIDSLLRWRREILAGRRIGPRALVTGRYVSNHSKPRAYRVNTPVEARAVADSIKAEGADHIKMHEIGSREAFFALAAASRRLGLPLVAHGYMSNFTTLEEASDSGQRSFEHLTDQVCDPVRSSSGSNDTATPVNCGAIAERLRRNNSWLMPAAGGIWSQPPLCRGADTVTTTEAQSWNPRCLTHPVTPAREWTVLPIMTGSDALLGFLDEMVMPNFRRILDDRPIQSQMARLVAAGMTPLAALQAATLNPAKYLNGTDSLGTVAPGKLADLLFLDDNPLDDIWNTTKIHAVVANGRYFDRAALDGIWTQLEQDAIARTAAASTTPVSSASALSSAQQRDRATAFVNVAVIPMDRERVLTKQTVLVKGNRIAAIGPTGRVRVPPDAVQIDGTGKYLMPGLGDMHVHIAYPNPDTASISDVLFAYLANGITTVRDMHSGGRLDRARQPTGSVQIALREQVAAGTLLGPRIYTSGDPDYSSPEAAAKSVRDLKADGHDFVKLSMDRSPNSRQLFDSIIAAARSVGLRVVGHVPPDIGVEPVLAAGLASTEHLDEYPEYLFGTNRRWSISDGGVIVNNVLPLADTADWAKPGYRVSPAQLRRLAQEVRRAGVWNCPTLYIFEDIQRGLDSMAAVLPPDSTGADTLQLFSTKHWRARARVVNRWTDVSRQIVRALRDAHAGLILGTDVMGSVTGHGFRIHQELAALVHAGLTPYQALETGTKNVATFLGTLDSTGTVAVGKRADLVLLSANPLRDIAATAGPAGVMVGGQWLSRTAIETRLDAFSPKYDALKNARYDLWLYVP